MLFSASAQGEGVSDIGLRSRTAEIDAGLFSETLSPIEQPESNLRLNLFDDVEILASRIRWAHLPNQGWSWHGVVPGDENSEITLVQNNGFISGNIRTEDGDYQIRTSVKGQLVIEEVDLSQLPEDDVPPVPDAVEESWTDEESRPSSSTASADGGPLIDVLVVYTKAAMDGAGSEAAIESEIMLAISETNEGYTQSNVSHRLRLADAVMTDWDETDGSFDFYSTLVKATHTNDGELDEIHALRDAVGADEVVILVEGDNTYCGIAWLMTTPSEYFAVNAFSVVARGCATGNYTFAHELGHNMGSNHDHDNADMGAYAFSYGLQIPDAGVRTIMAYSCPTSYCRRINRWSNPGQNWDGHPMGVSGTGTEAADNHLSLNQTASIVAAFRDVPEETTSLKAPEILSPSAGSKLNGPSAAFVLEDVGADQYALTFGSSIGSAELGQYDLYSSTTQWATGLPEDGRTIYVRAWARTGDEWVYTDTTFTAHTAEVATVEIPEITSPAPGAVLPGSSATFEWTASSATEIVLRVGRTKGSADVGQYAAGTATSYTIEELPTDGERVWVSLYALIDGVWDVSYAQYDTVNLTGDFAPADMLSPSADSDIASDVAFNWSNPCNCSYRLMIRDQSGALIFDSGTQFETAISVTGLPRDHEIQATLYTMSEGRVFGRDYAYRVR